MSTATAHQLEKLKEVLDLVVQKNPFIVLKGSAGVGKTYLLDLIIQTLEMSLPTKKTIICSAPTHKALSIIRQKVNSQKAEFVTAHSVLQYRAIRNPKTGEKEFKSKPNFKKPPLRGVKYLIIDEASMISKDMIENIEEYASKEQTTVIYVGDDKQINPVKELHSLVFHKDYPTVELTEIIRQGDGNPIIHLSRNLEELWDKKNNLVGEDNPIGYLHTQNEAKIVEQLALANGTDAFKYLAWSNEEVDRMNTLVRRRLYGPNPDKIELGETLIFDASYKNGEYNTNEEVKVDSVYCFYKEIEITLENNQRVPVTIMAKFRVYCVNEDILILHDDSLGTFKKYTYTTGTNCSKKLLDYETRGKFLDTFATVKYNHALTVHKSQGSTYDTTALNIQNINLNRVKEEKERLFYTGVTRAKDLVILYSK